MVKWVAVCRPKSRRGLGILNSKVMNVALLLKWDFPEGTISNHPVGVLFHMITLMQQWTTPVVKTKDKEALALTSSRLRALHLSLRDVRQ